MRDIQVFDTESVRSRFRSIIARATPEQRIAASRWYCEARTFAESLTFLRPEWSLETAASVISAYSPRTRWAHNKTKAVQHAMRMVPRGITAHYATARLAEADGFNALRGLKTNAFARAIAGDPNAVVIDTWMMKAAGIDRDAPTVRQYRAMVDIVRDIAPDAALTPAETQALIWIVQRGSAE